MTPYRIRVPTVQELERGEGGATWESFPNTSGESIPPRNAHAQACIDKLIYVFGGRKGVELEEDNMADLWVFDTESKEWSEVRCREDANGGRPAPRSYHVACAAGGKVYVFGGCSCTGRLADLHVFDPATKTWETLPSPPNLEGRGGATLEAFQSSDGDLSLALFSGFEGKESKDYLTYSIANQQWTVHTSPESMEKRSVCSSFTARLNKGQKEGKEEEEVMIVYGGETAPSERGHEGAGNFSEEVFAFTAKGDVTQVALKNSSDKSSNPVPRGWASGAALSDQCGVFYGGLTGSDENPVRLSDLWVLQLSK